MVYTLKLWRTALLVPLFKKGESTCPSSYKPIAILSHTRKVIEIFFSMSIREKYKFHESQLGIETGISTETAIMRHISNTKIMPLAAILDLKSAYDQVSKKKLYCIVTKTQAEDVRWAISFALKLIEIRAQGVTTETKEVIERRVRQGSHLSRTLSSVYRNTLPRSLQTKPGTVRESRQPTTLRESYDTTLFADDVQLQAGSEGPLQHIMNTTTRWAVKYKMIRSTNKIKILQRTNQDNKAPFTLATQTQETEEKQTYLEVTSSAKVLEPEAADLGGLEVFRDLRIQRFSGISRGFRLGQKH